MIEQRYSDSSRHFIEINILSDGEILSLGNTITGRMEGATELSCDAEVSKASNSMLKSLTETMGLIRQGRLIDDWDVISGC